MSTPDPALLERHGLTLGRIPAHRAIPGTRPDPDRAGHLLRDVVRALQLQELANPLEEAPDPGAARRAGPRRERRRRRHRRRLRRRLQDRVAQPSVVHRAVPGRRHRRGRHHPRHLHDGRPADRAPQLAPLRPDRRARRGAHPAHRRRCGGGHRRLRQQHRHPDHRRRDCLRAALRREPARQCPVPRHRARRRSREGAGRWCRQPGLLRGRQHRPRRDPRRHHGLRGVR